MSIFSLLYLEIDWEISYNRLKVLYIVFQELSKYMVAGFRFCHFSSIFRGLELCLGNRKNSPVTSQGSDKIWHCFKFQSLYHRVSLCKKSQTLHKINNYFLNKPTNCVDINSSSFFFFIINISSFRSFFAIFSW